MKSISCKSNKKEAFAISEGFLETTSLKIEVQNILYFIRFCS